MKIDRIILFLIFIVLILLICKTKIKGGMGYVNEPQIPGLATEGSESCSIGMLPLAIIYSDIIKHLLLDLIYRDTKSVYTIYRIEALNFITNPDLKRKFLDINILYTAKDIADYAPIFFSESSLIKKKRGYCLSFDNFNEMMYGYYARQAPHPKEEKYLGSTGYKLIHYMFNSSLVPFDKQAETNSILTKEISNFCYQKLLRGMNILTLQHIFYGFYNKEDNKWYFFNRSSDERVDIVKTSQIYSYLSFLNIVDILIILKNDSKLSTSDINYEPYNDEKELNTKIITSDEYKQKNKIFNLLDTGKTDKKYNFISNIYFKDELFKKVYYDVDSYESLISQLRYDFKNKEFGNRPPFYTYEITITSNEVNFQKADKNWKDLIEYVSQFEKNRYGINVNINFKFINIVPEIKIGLNEHFFGIIFLNKEYEPFTFLSSVTSVEELKKIIKNKVKIDTEFDLLEANHSPIDDERLKSLMYSSYIVILVRPRRTFYIHIPKKPIEFISTATTYDQLESELNSIIINNFYDATQVEITTDQIVLNKKNFSDIINKKRGEIHIFLDPRSYNNIL